MPTEVEHVATAMRHSYAGEGFRDKSVEEQMEELAATALQASSEYRSGERAAVDLFPEVTACWFTLPPSLRKRWWHETDYGRVAPTDELQQAIRDASKVNVE